eukprot:GSMAST32.ASY1.ANO1.899.1 assembled CDS
MVNSSNTCIYSHDECLLHNIKDHVEQPARVREIMLALRSFYPKIPVVEAPLATETQLLRFHSERHLYPNKKRHRPAIAKGQRVEKIDTDTFLTRYTQNAFLRASGASVAAVDAVLSSTYKRAFCVVRPPGHHSGPSTAAGFCFVNNIGVGVRHAQEVYGLTRVAVVDFDVHHGNGTQKGFELDPNVFYASTHQMPLSTETGCCRNVTNVPYNVSFKIEFQFFFHSKFRT